MLSEYELLNLMAALVSGDGQRSVTGAVATARAIVDEVRAQEPRAAAAHDRARLAAAWAAAHARMHRVPAGKAEAADA